MNTSKVSDWLQIGASIGVIVGLILVAYEIRVSNRIGNEQAIAQSWLNYNFNREMALTTDVSDLFLRVNEGDELSREEAFKLNHFLDSWITAANYDFLLIKGETLVLPGGFDDAFRYSIQFWLGSEYGRRRWAATRSGYEPDFIDAVDRALAAPDERKALDVLDFYRGVREAIN